MKTLFFSLLTFLWIGNFSIAKEPSMLEGISFPAGAVESLSAAEQTELGEIIQASRLFLSKATIQQLVSACLKANPEEQASVEVSLGSPHKIKIPKYASQCLADLRLPDLGKDLVQLIEGRVARLEVLASKIRQKTAKNDPLPTATQKTMQQTEEENPFQVIQPQEKHFLVQGTQEIDLSKTRERRNLPAEVPGMNNVSLSQAGSNVAFCLDEGDECAFRSPSTGITVSGLAPGREPTRPDRDVLFDYDEGQAYCQALNWAGVQKWRLPSFREITFLSKMLVAVSNQFKSFGKNNTYLWTSGFPNEDYREDLFFDLTKAWILSPETSGKRHHPKNMKAGLRCVKNDAEKLWRDVSTFANSTTLAPCTEPGRECSFELNQSRIQVTAPLTYQAGTLNKSGVHQSTAKSFCEQLKWNGKSGWRIPTFEEGYDLGLALFKGFALSRDAIVELPEGRFWVEPPKFGDFEDSPVQPHQTVLFSGYACNFEGNKCDRIRDLGAVHRYPGQGEQDLSRNKIICVHP